MARLAGVKLCAEALGPLCTAAAEQGPQSPAEQLTSECGITKGLFPEQPRHLGGGACHSYLTK